MFAQTHPETGCSKMAAILVGTEVAVVQVFGEMDMAESIAAANGKLIVMPWEPAQRFSPFALTVIAVRVVTKSKTPCDGKIMSVIINMAVPAMRQQVKRRGIKRGRNWISREAARNIKPLYGIEFQVSA